MATKQNLIFKDAEKAKAAIMKSQQKEIKDLYVKWADDIGKKAEMYAKKTTPSSALQETQMKTLKKQLTAASKQISNEIYGIIKNNMYLMSNAVVGDSKKWMKSLGFGDEAANMMFTNIPDSTVRNIITGQIYDSGWSLSKAIWSDNEKNLKDIYAIVGKGIAENSSIYDISKELETYVNPNKKLPWNFKGKDGVKIFKKSVDYNAQRLARTLVQHGYQQSFIAVTKDNPLVEEYLWLANGSRVCPICKARNGKHYSKDNLPMDHPNGMCTMVPVVNSNMIDDLADWVKNPDKNPKLTKFAKKLGYKESQIKAGDVVKIKNVSKSKTDTKKILKFTNAQEKYLAKYGYSVNNMPKDYDEWFIKLTFEDNIALSKWGIKANKSVKELFDKYLNVKKYKTVKIEGITDLENDLESIKKTLSEIPEEIYKDIWNNPVTDEEYKALIKGIANKKNYYNMMINDLKDETSFQYQFMVVQGGQDPIKEIAKYEKYIKDIEKLESKGESYFKLVSKANKIEDKIEDKITEIQFANLKPGEDIKFDVDLFTKEAKDDARKFVSRDAADRWYRPQLDKTWNNATEKEKYSVWEYTQNSNPINKSLSGYHDSWDRKDFKGLGKTDLGHEDKWRNFRTKEFEDKFGKDGHKNYKMVVENLTKIIDKSEMKESAYLVRGSDVDGLAGLLEGNLISFDDAKSLIKTGGIRNMKKMLNGQKFTNHAFTSTGISSGTGFSGDIVYEIYAPKGTRYIYAEPTSYYGDTISGENIYKVGQDYDSIGSEAEIILQRGTTFIIRDVEKEGNKIKIKMDVVEQPDYFKTGLEYTHTKGKTTYTK